MKNANAAAESATSTKLTVKRETVLSVKASVRAGRPRPPQTQPGGCNPSRGG